MARPFTAIDMALGRLHLDAILAAFGHAIGANLGRPLTKGLGDPRPAPEPLAAPPRARLHRRAWSSAWTLSLGEAGRRGRFPLILPLSALDVIRASIQVRNDQAARDRPNDLWKTLMRRAAASAPVRVDAVLHRQRLSLAALQALQVGQVLEIPRQSVEEIQLAIPQPGGRTALLAQGTARRLPGPEGDQAATPPDRRVVTHIDRALRPPRSGARRPAAAGPRTGRVAEIPPRKATPARSRRARTAPGGESPDLAPAGQQVARRRPRRMDAAGHGPGEAERGGMAEHHLLERLGPGRAPVETPNTRSPSNGVCAGQIARASPACATSASRPRAGLVEGGSVATIAIVVFAPGRRAPASSAGA